MTVRVTKKDRGARELFERLRELRQLSIMVGFQEPDGSKIHPLADVPVATVAMFNEYGTIDSPARPFMRTTLLEHAQEIAQHAANVSAKVVEGKLTPVEAASKHGALVCELMRERVRRANSWAEPNAPRTVQKKGHSRVLFGGDPAKNVEAGTMLDAITWTVRKGSTILARGK